MAGVIGKLGDQRAVVFLYVVGVDNGSPGGTGRRSSARSGAATVMPVRLEYSRPLTPA